MTTTDPTITIAGLRAQVESLIESIGRANSQCASFCDIIDESRSVVARVEAERDALAAQFTEVRAELVQLGGADLARDAAEDRAARLDADLAKVRAELAKAPKVCAIHSYALEGPCMTCGAPWPGAEKALRQERIEGMEKMRRISRAVGCPNSVEEVVEAVAAIKADLASERAHLAACRTRIAGLEQAANERSAEVARLTARVAELEARPVLTDEALSAALNVAGLPGGHAPWIMAKLGPVTLPPAQDRADELVSAWRGICTDSATCDLDPAERMRRALASLGAPPTSHPAARPVFAGVSEEELALEYARAVDRIPGIRAVLARLEVSLVAPVDPEEVARDYANNAATGYAPGIDHPPYWFEYTDEQRTKRTAAMRATLIARGIPVTPEVDK